MFRDVSATVRRCLVQPFRMHSMYKYGASPLADHSERSDSGTQSWKQARFVAQMRCDSHSGGISAECRITGN
jgi:hypothetical protein